ncbi:hypothetical protein CONLIGDRAFT_312147 [Coniochaeta ligniaria NRRL 30616]|uniref:Uncharacterized protein n=1 Tax=Coniochaeta ligniaria NRRL 30616 TaxID=1408157 RepID=A0A1J7JUC2_9PEZI|nr:hypothetical protein CONLIGDRAFT_312147 [Coniochaeta ligniaria NRRL 30616]
MCTTRTLPIVLGKNVPRRREGALPQIPVLRQSSRGLAGDGSGRNAPLKLRTRRLEQLDISVSASRTLMKRLGSTTQQLPEDTSRLSRSIQGESPELCSFEAFGVFFLYQPPAAKRHAGCSRLDELPPQLSRCVLRTGSRCHEFGSQSRLLRYGIVNVMS